MKKELSIYLDFARISAAFLVLIYHSNGMGITGGFLWQLGGYGQTAVMIFFVLSGYVIAHVSSKREKELSTYTFARLSRMYSVVIPALIVTFLCNELGQIFIQKQYSGPWNSNEPLEYYRYFITFFMLQDYWAINLSPSNNGPFWSISFEITYYIIFASIYFSKNKTRALLFSTAIALAAGPTIVFLFPIWLLGVLIYRIHENGTLNCPKYCNDLLFIGSIIALAFSPDYREFLNTTIPGINRESIAGDFLDGLLFSLNLLTAPVFIERIRAALTLFSKPIAFLASLTFSFYLFHQPLIRLLAGVSPFIDNPSSISNRVFVLAGTFFIIVIIGLPCERYKSKLNTSLRKISHIISRQLKTI